MKVIQKKRLRDQKERNKMYIHTQSGRKMRKKQKLQNTIQLSF